MHRLSGSALPVHQLACRTGSARPQPGQGTPYPRPRRGAGVDMASPAPVADALTLFGTLVDELEALTR